MIRVGLVGLGFMGWIHWLTHRKLRGSRVVAVCETDPRRLTGDLRGIQGNFGPPGEQIDFSGIATHANYDDLLADVTQPDEPDVHGVFLTVRRKGADKRDRRGGVGTTMGNREIVEQGEWSAGNPAGQRGWPQVHDPGIRPYPSPLRHRQPSGPPV